MLQEKGSGFVSQNEHASLHSRKKSKMSVHRMRAIRLFPLLANLLTRKDTTRSARVRVFLRAREIQKTEPSQRLKRARASRYVRY